MVRTQIYLTESEREGLDAAAKAMGKSQSELIREAVDRYLSQHRGPLRETALEEAAGLWRERSDLPDFAAVRSGLDRS